MFWLKGWLGAQQYGRVGGKTKHKIDGIRFRGLTCFIGSLEDEQAAQITVQKGVVKSVPVRSDSLRGPVRYTLPLGMWVAAVLCQVAQMVPLVMLYSDTGAILKERTEGIKLL